MEARCTLCKKEFSTVMKVYGDHGQSEPINIAAAAGGCHLCHVKLVMMIPRTVTRPSTSSQQHMLPRASTSKQSMPRRSSNSSGQSMSRRSSNSSGRNLSYLSWSPEIITAVLQRLKEFRERHGKLPRSKDYKKFFQSSLSAEYLEGEKLKGQIQRLKKKCDELHNKKNELRGTENQLYQLMISVWPRE